jgi:hypothetical protein
MSDFVTCPSCGPAWGLILLPSHVVERRIRSGILGCPNCRGRYVIEGGVADLRAGGAAPFGAARGTREWDALGLGALLGLEVVRGVILLAGPAVSAAVALADLVPDAEVVVLLGDDEPAPAPDAPVSRLRIGATLPLRNRSVAAVALTGGATALVAEAARVLGPAARLLLDPAPEPGSPGRPPALHPLVEEGGVIVLAPRA